jgi:hypothetical protein
MKNTRDRDSILSLPASQLCPEVSLLDVGKEKVLSKVLRARGLIEWIPGPFQKTYLKDSMLSYRILFHVRVRSTLFFCSYTFPEVFTEIPHFFGEDVCVWMESPGKEA